MKIINNINTDNKKIGICKTKSNIDLVYTSLLKGLCNNNHVKFINNNNDLKKENYDILIMVAYPTRKFFCDEYDNLKSKDYYNLIKKYNFDDFRNNVVDYTENKRIPLLIIDTGLFNNDRSINIKNSYHITMNGFKNLGFKYSIDSDNIRFIKNNIKIKPIITKDIPKRILVFGQTRFGIASQHIDINNWYKCVFEYLLDNNKKIIFKNHPNDKDTHNWKHVEISNLNIKDIKPDAAISFSSNVVVQSILEGIPNIAISKISVGYEICSNFIENIDKIKNINIEQWLYNLSYENWSLEEISNGTWWEYMKDKINGNYNINKLYGL